MQRPGPDAKPLLIYLAELFHVQHAGRNDRNSPYTVPLGIGFLASTVKHAEPQHEIVLFRDPDRLLKAARERAPDIVGFSFCTWNTDLSTRALAAVKAAAPGVVSVGGGPSVDDADEQIRTFFTSVPDLDFLIPNEGETGFLALVRAVASGASRAGPIPGVAYLGATGELVRGAYQRPIVLDETGQERLSPKQTRALKDGDVAVPSPYLDGTLDSFLDEGLVPIVQTMRGCPYQCKFCVSGATEWNRMRAFDLPRVKAEIDYALTRSGAKGLILTDENWGILGDRDIELANYIWDRHCRLGAPEKLYYYTAKIVTAASRQIVERMAPIAWIGEFSMSFQSLNAETRQEIKRTNISLEKVEENVRWARERGISTSSEMIYGMPYETPETFLDGVEWLSRAGIETIQVFPLLLFPGIDLASEEARRKNATVTRFRLPDWAYGVYDEGRLISVEAEEVIYTTRWSSEDDYFVIRRYGFFQQVVQGRQYMAEFSRLCADLGAPADSLIRHLTMLDYANYPHMTALLADHRRDGLAELAETRDEIYQRIVDHVVRGVAMEGLRVNLVYLARLFGSDGAVRELLTILRSFAERQFGDQPAKSVATTYIDDILANRIVILRRDRLDDVRFESRFDYSRWTGGGYADGDDLLSVEPHRFVAEVSSELKKNVQQLDYESRASLQGLFETTASKCLLRRVKEIGAAALN